MAIKVSKDIEVPEKVLDKAVQKELARLKRAEKAALKKVEYYKNKYQQIKHENRELFNEVQISRELRGNLRRFIGLTNDED